MVEMNQSEIDSFVSKFRNLCRAGRNANLTFTSKAGKASVNLSVELGRLPDVEEHHHKSHHHSLPHPRFGNSRQRRREKRAEIRKVKAVEAAQELSPEEAEILKLAEEASNVQDSEEDRSCCKDTAKSESTEKVLNEPNDELCPDKEYEKLEENCVTYSFQSEYGKWDIEDTLSELFPDDVATLESRVRMTPLGADHLCSVKVKGQSISWPEMKGENVEIIREIKRIQM